MKRGMSTISVYCILKSDQSEWQEIQRLSTGKRENTSYFPFHQYIFQISKKLILISAFNLGI